MNDGVWRILDSIAFVVIAECIIRLAVPEDKKRYSFTAYILLLFIPILSLSSCGWGAVTCNYLWPCAEIMPAFVIMKKMFNKEKVPAWQFVVSILLAVFACNQEQMAALVFGITFVLLAYRFAVKEKSIKYNWYFFVILVISLASLIFILTCPGNGVRFEAALQEYFPDYEKMSFFTKGFMSIPLIFSFFLGISLPNVVIVPLLFALTFIAFVKNKKAVKLLAVILDLFVLIFGFCGFVLQRFIPVFIFQNQYLYPYGNVALPVSVIEIAVFTVLAVILAVAVFKCSRDRKKGLLNLMLLAAGYCSSAIIAFSPTVYEASWGRTFFFTFIIIDYIALDLLFTSKS
ncbi:MAG: hypothetical protein J6Y16_00360 [Treponema sp.]|nr:hypothetical protein [Treponema sp.]